MSTDRSDIESYAVATATVLGLAIPEESRPRVVDALVMAASAAALILAFPLDDADDEAASVFRPGGPR